MACPFTDFQLAAFERAEWLWNVLSWATIVAAIMTAVMARLLRMRIVGTTLALLLSAAGFGAVSGLIALTLVLPAKRMAPTPPVMVAQATIQTT